MAIDATQEWHTKNPDEWERVLMYGFGAFIGRLLVTPEGPPNMTKALKDALERAFAEVFDEAYELGRFHVEDE